MDSMVPPSTVIETQPKLWAESASLMEPWAQLRLTCRARMETQDFQLFKDGVALEPVHLAIPAIAHQFVLGKVTMDNRGLYHCRTGLGERWTQLSDLLEVTGTGEQGTFGAALRIAQRPSLSFPTCGMGSSVPRALCLFLPMFSMGSSSTEPPF